MNRSLYKRVMSRGLISARNIERRLARMPHPMVPVGAGLLLLVIVCAGIGALGAMFFGGAK